MKEVKTQRDWHDIAFRLSALCGGFEKYDIVEDTGLSAKNRRKSSQERPNDQDLIRRGSLPQARKKGTQAPLQDSRISLTKRSLSDGVVVVEKNTDFSTRKIDRSPKSHSLDLDVSSFDFSELRSSSLCSTEL
ncbi:unnamed protein product [Pocillopora meandrina]|uniref:Uncharacterized protein n=1 Tax=Pocillopora meandrina TaxID=46732 RepID=A0AAU9WXY0_9CNID|nr:unnamed protein product [Pocillopora meandrina]